MSRLPFIRHLRYFWLSYRVHKWARDCAQIGLGLGYPNESDLRHLQAIWHGKA